MRETKGLGELGRNDPCWCGSGLKYKKCHMARDSRAPASQKNRWLPQRSPGPRAPSTLIKTDAQIEGIRKACRLTRELLDMLGPRIAAGVSTDEINDWVHEMTLSREAKSAPLNYKGFPKSVCTSVNGEVCHAIPGERVLVSGDIVNVDVSPILGGFYGDASRMFLIGEVSEGARRLVQVTRECLEIGIAQVRPGGFVGDIGQAIQTHAEKHGFSVVRDFVGHGVGLRFHEEPQIPHFGRKGHGPPLLPGMIFTIEPMINAGDWRIKILPDGWTAVTVDGSLSAQWEHTLLVTTDGVEVLTA